MNAFRYNVRSKIKPYALSKPITQRYRGNTCRYDQLQTEIWTKHKFLPLDRVSLKNLSEVEDISSCMLTNDNKLILKLSKMKQIKNLQNYVFTSSSSEKSALNMY